MKPHAPNYIGPAYLAVFALNYLFSYIQTNIKSDYAVLLLAVVVLIELATAIFSTMKFVNDSKKFEIKTKLEKNSTSR